ncbi:hypothetical protein BLNAU_6065 [Blattamonas nauphoetae]|uniref:Uncharacterized protein n=1 Tax=Blattamonas nauphoetae TaxID=2049346 RepID=A0ABQ9Y5V8_9EUKA|nr:hypothetical protein BLNAU_6065 [Blattamonas nauphoetae]
MNKPQLAGLISDRFANYVFKRMIERVEGNVFEISTHSPFSPKTRLGRVETRNGDDIERRGHIKRDKSIGPAQNSLIASSNATTVTSRSALSVHPQPCRDISIKTRVQLSALVGVVRERQNGTGHPSADTQNENIV